jgi:co-chaperonin GroES (HSP10)
MKVTGKIKPLRDTIFVTDMEFGEQKSTGGIVVLSANGKSRGIHPRWAKVWAIGDDQKHIKVGEWILIEHGRWTRTVEMETETEVIEIRMVDNKAILMTSDEQPTDINRAPT